MTKLKGKWFVRFVCQSCNIQWCLEYAAETPQEELLERHVYDKRQKYCPFCDGGKSQLVRIEYSGIVDLRDSQL